ncbi:MAG: hypothetical protein RIQ89_1927 [Bacteroidota bacterium]|jgi:hypothetical protein
MGKLISFVSLILLLHIGCEREQLQTANTETIFTIDTTLEVGNVNQQQLIWNNVLQHLDLPFVGGKQLELDLDLDLINDLKFSIGFAVSPGGLNIRTVALTVLDSACTISAFEQYDSIVSYTFSYPGGTGTSTANYLAGNTYPANATIQVFSNQYISTGSTQQLITPTNQLWKKGSFNLYYRNATSNPVNNANITLGNWLDGQAHYLLFKIDKNNQIKLGWIEVKLVSTSSLEIYSMGIKTLIY